MITIVGNGGGGEGEWWSPRVSSDLENQQVSGMDIGVEELALLNGKGPNLGTRVDVMGLGSGIGLSRKILPLLSERKQSLSSQMSRRCCKGTLPFRDRISAFRPEAKRQGLRMRWH